MGTGIRHARLAVRSLLRKPAFSAVAVVTLALGIGANTAIFSIIYGSLLEPLPYAEPDRLVYLSDGHDDFGGTGIDQTIPNLLDLRDGSRLMESMAMFSYGSRNLAAGDQPERISVLETSSELLSVLGVAAALGRDLNPGDDVAGAERVAVLSHGLWRRSFGADSSVIGRTMILDAATVRIVGVTPEGFSFPSDPQMLVPIRHIGGEFSRGYRNYNGIGRLTPGATVDALRSELQAIFDGLVERYPAENGNGWFTWADPLEAFALGSNQQSLCLLGGAVFLVLLMACVNVANLLLVRGETRHRELAVRFAMGANRGGLLPYFVSEGVVLSLLGGGVGTLAAIGGVDLLVALSGGSLARTENIGVNTTVLGFSLVVSLVAGLAVGLVPLARATPARVHDSLKDGARGSSGRASRLGRSLVVTQVALALVVVSGAGLLMKSLWRVQEVDLGLGDLDRMLTFEVTLPTTKYETGQPVVAFYDALARDLESIPGVEAVGFVNRLPLLGGWNARVGIWGEPESALDFVSFRPVTEGYFDALGMRLVAGRWIEEIEFVDGAPVALINETMARRLFGEREPVGQHVSDWIEGGMLVVGIVSDVKGSGPTRPTPPALYFPFATFGGVQAAAGIIRATGDLQGLTPLMRESVAKLDPQLPLYRVRTMREVAREGAGGRRFAVSLFGVFAGLALLLGAVGIYGVMSFSVTQRWRELGVRLALGAGRMSVLKMVLGEGALLVGPGILIGIVLALASGHLLRSLLFEVSTIDPATLVVVVAVLSLVALCATYVPARRATRVDPLTSIRTE